MQLYGYTIIIEVGTETPLSPEQQQFIAELVAVKVEELDEPLLDLALIPTPKMIILDKRMEETL